MQAVRMDILKNSLDERCSLLYQRALKTQTTWTRQYSPAVEHAMAETVVESNPVDNLFDCTLKGKDPTPLPPPVRRKRITSLIAEIDTQEQIEKLQKLQIQGKWLEYTNVMNCDLSWRRLIHGFEDGELSFILRAISNTLPTPDNLKRWGNGKTDDACFLCGKPATLRHILTACRVAFRQGRFNYRHDSVLAVLRKHILNFAAKIKSERKTSTSLIKFVREGKSKITKTAEHRRPLFSNDAIRCAGDWVMLFDL